MKAFSWIMDIRIHLCVKLSFNIP